MKNIYYIVGLIGAISLASCDKVENPYPETIETELDYTLYPGGDSAAYAATEWPVFGPNANTVRNIMIEDFTGHLCTYCPYAADTAHSLHEDYPNRILIATVHAGPTSTHDFQQTSVSFPVDWTNAEGKAIGEHFGEDYPGSNFFGNPRGSVSRILNAGQYTLGEANWRSAAVAGMGQPLKVNIQSAANFYPSTSGVFLHTEIDILDPSVLDDDPHLVVYLIEDSLVGKQKYPGGVTDDNYVHRDIMRGCISSTWEGRPWSDAREENGKYYFDYSYKLPAQYNPANVHFLIYVRGGSYADSKSEEVYHVIKQELP